MKIRPRIPEDATAITHVQVTTWRSAYQGIVPQSYLDNMQKPDYIENRVRNWTNALLNPECIGFVAENDASQVVGFVFGGGSRPENGDLCSTYDAELYALYLLPEYHGQRIGRKLVEALGQKLVQTGHHHMLLWVLTENHPSRAFYERMGGQEIKAQPFTLDGMELWETGYGYDLSIFA